MNCILKNWDRFDPRGLKKTHLVFLCDTAWPQCPLEDSERWPVGGSLKYNTVLQLDWFCTKQRKWVEVAYVLLFFAVQNMPDLGPEGIDLGMKPSAPPIFLLYPHTRGSKLRFQLPWSQWKPKLRYKLPQYQWKPKLRFTLSM